MPEDILTLNKDDSDLKESKSASPKPVINEKYDKKKSYLKRQIIISVIISGIFLMIFIAINIYYKNSMSSEKRELKKISREIIELNNKSDDIESRVNDVKKYKPVWLKVDKKRKDFEGIKISNISDIFKKIADDYDINNFSINISAPGILKDKHYDNTTFNVNLVDIKLNFTSFTDQAAMDFIASFLDIMPGYVVINNISLVKSKKEFYTDSELVKISTGQIKGSVTSSVDFHWYFLKYKDTIKPVTKSDKI
ncbi:MAG: cell division protein FtsL [Lentimonas sp.]|jgi:cell division protein FtsL